MSNWWANIQKIMAMKPIEQKTEAICQLPGMLNLDSVDRVLMIAPHPDDEVLGCGGTLTLLAKRATVKVILVTDGSGAGELPEGTDKIRKQEMTKALNVLGIENLICLDEPDGFFTNSRQFSQRIEQIVTEFSPEWIFIPAVDDFHRDHRRIAQAVIDLQPRFKLPLRLFQFEVWNPVTATHVVDITTVMDIKHQALHCHQSILSCAPYEEAITGLNRYRSLYLPVNPGKIQFAECYREHLI